MKTLLFLLTFIVGTINAQNTIIYDDGSLHESLETPQTNKTTNVTAACPATNNLFTFYAQNNAQRGIMFDLQAINSVVIQCFDVNLAVGTTNVEIYTKAGTHVGFQNTPGAWVLVGTAVNLVAAGANLATYVPVIVNIPIATGNTQAFYITRTTAGGPVVDYTNGVLVGNLLASDANLSIFDGTGKDYPFGASFAPRQFNGRIYYNTGVLPIELISFEGYHRDGFNLLTWVSATETNNDFYTLERSIDATNWVSVSNINGAGNSNTNLFYEYKDYDASSSLNYYRLKQTDRNGQFKYYNIISIDDTKVPSKQLIKVTNMMGQEVSSDTPGILIYYYSDGTHQKVVKSNNF
jgi:hypothetical protein